MSALHPWRTFAKRHRTDSGALADGARMVKLHIEMEKIAKKLNDPAVLPPLAYRRNHVSYELVGYVNCLIGCRISGNSEGEALFIERVAQFMGEHPETPDVAEYYGAVRDYVGSRN